LFRSPVSYRLHNVLLSCLLPQMSGYLCVLCCGVLYSAVQTPNVDYKNKDSRVSEWPCDKTGVCNFATRVSSLNGHNKRGYNVSD